MAERRRRGLSIASAAAVTSVDEETFRKWENGEWKPQPKSWPKIRMFLRMPTRALKDRT